MYVIASHRNELCGGSGLSVAHVSGNMQAAYGTVGQVKKESNINENKNNEPTIIKDGRKQYYLIDTKLYKVKRDKSQGKLFGSYIDGKIIE